MLIPPWFTHYFAALDPWPALSGGFNHKPIETNKRTGQRKRPADQQTQTRERGQVCAQLRGTDILVNELAWSQVSPAERKYEQ